MFEWKTSKECRSAFLLLLSLSLSLSLRSIKYSTLLKNVFLIIITWYVSPQLIVSPKTSTRHFTSEAKRVWRKDCQSTKPSILPVPTYSYIEFYNPKAGKAVRHQTKVSEKRHHTPCQSIIALAIMCHFPKQCQKGLEETLTVECEPWSLTLLWFSTFE